MATEPKRVEITRATDIVALTEEVEQLKEERLLQRNGRTVAKLSPVEEMKVGGFAPGDSIWNIVGMDTSDGDPDTSSNKHKHVADAYDTPER